MLCLLIVGARISSSSGEEEVAATLDILGLNAVERAVEYLSSIILDPVTRGRNSFS